ncbi:hypothetical protein HC928_20995 [bacterium]|nr:hypothetical protein [bacterium]
MDLEQRVKILEEEIQILKNQIQATLLDIQETLLAQAHPELKPGSMPLSDGVEASSRALRSSPSHQTPWLTAPTPNRPSQ